MKKSLLPVILSVMSIIISAWSHEGHSTVGLIAERHLSSQAKQAVQTLLKGESLSSVASWADEVRNQPEYRTTAPWHFVNVPLGLDAKEFANAVETSPNQNLLTAIHKCEGELVSSQTTVEEKTIALKFLIHFVGDAHQPMHVSRAEDKGGNSVQVQFDDKGTNLHSLWDSKLIDKQGQAGEALVKLIDTAKPDQIAKWQSTSPIDWMFESYQISSQLYKEVEANNKLGEEYYTNHINIVNTRLEEGGIRLAGLLNSLFKRGLQPSNAATGQSEVRIPGEGWQTKSIPLADVSNHIGESVRVTGRVYSFKELASMTLVNLGAAYPNQVLTVVLRADAKSLGTTIDQKFIEISGKVINYNGKPEIEVRDPNNLKVVPTPEPFGVR